MKVFGIPAVGGGLAIDPCLQVIAYGTNPHRDPLTILRCRFGCARTFYVQSIDAPRRVVTVSMVQLSLIAGRKFLFLIGVRCAAEIDPTISSPTSGIADAGFRIKFEVVEFLERGEITLSPRGR